MGGPRGDDEHRGTAGARAADAGTSGSRARRDATRVVDALMAAGGPDDASRAARLLLRTWGAPSRAVAEVRLALSSIQLMSGRSTEALREAEVVASQPGLPDELYAEATVDRLNALVGLRDLPRACRLADDVLAGREGHSGHEALAGALHVTGLAAWQDGRLTDAVHLLTIAARRAELGSDATRRTYPRLSVVPVFLAGGDFAHARAAITDAEVELRRTGDRAWAPGPVVQAARLDLAVGQPDRAEATAKAALDLSEQLGTRLFVAAATCVRMSVALLRGDVATAKEQVRSIRREPVDVAGFSEGVYLWQEGRLAEAEGRPEAARWRAVRLAEHIEHHRRLLLEEPGAAAWLVRMALASGDEARARAVSACAAGLAAANPGRDCPLAVAHHARGLVERDAAAVACAAGGHRQPWARASAHEDAGTLLAEDGASEAGVEHLHEAAVLYRRTGAECDARRVRQKVRDLHSARRRRVRRPATGWASLTAAERRVAGLVVLGHTNAEAAAQLFMSRHTVDAHLRKIYRKMGIRSRVELARVAPGAAWPYERSHG